MRRQRRMILGDDPGMGKTPQAVKASRPPVLVVCPKIARKVWYDHFLEWEPRATPTYNIKAIETGEADVLIVKWDDIVAGQKTESGAAGPLPAFLARLLRIQWRTIVADEAHRAKNRNAQRTRGLYQLANRRGGKSPERVFLLTGTPIENDPTELWSLLHILDPKYYSSYWRFVDDEIIKGEIPNTPVHVFKVLGLIRPNRFRKMHVKPWLLRRSKDDPKYAAQLPKKIHADPIYVDMTPKQSKAYTEFAEELVTFVGDELLIAENLLSSFARLRQLALTLGTYDRKLVEESGKLQALDEFMSDHSGPIVISTESRFMAEHVAKRYKGVYIHGQVSEKNRNKAVADFQSGKVDVFVMTSRTGGLAITLTRAHTMMFLDKPWNPEQMRQAEDRLHRIGQTNNVVYHSIIARGSIDEHVEKLHEHKENLKKQVFPTPEEFASAILPRESTASSHRPRSDHRRRPVRAGRHDLRD